MGNAAIDTIIRLKNGYMAHRESIEVPYSRFRLEVLKKLKELGYIGDFEVQGETVKKIVVRLAYEDGLAALSDVKLYSKPGRRWYARATQITSQFTSLGITLLSTSEGILTHHEAKKKKIGGELLFSVW